MPTEQSNVEQPKIEEKFAPREGESMRKYFERIGGSNIEIVEDLEKYSMPRLRVKRPLAINAEGTWIMNNQNIGKYFGKKDIKKIEDAQSVEDSGINFVKTRKEYQISKEAFEDPQKYLGAILAMIKKGKGQLVVDEKAFDNIIKWAYGEEKPEEKPEEKLEEKPEEKPKEKPITLDEKIEQKRKEIEEIERKYNIYYSPAVQDLMGLYYKEKYKGLKKMKKELKELEKKRGKGEVKEPEGMPEEVPEAPTTGEQLKEIKKDLRKITKKISKGGVLGRADLEKKQYELEKLKKKVEERLEIEKRLKKISKKIEQGGVLGRSKLEKEQRKLEKKLKKLEKK